MYHSGALGDFITALPALELLSRSAPLALWTRPLHSQLAAGASLSIASHYDVGSPGIPTVAAERAFLFAAPSSRLPDTLRERRITVYRHSPRPADERTHVVDFHAASAAKVLRARYAPGAVPRLAPTPDWGSELRVPLLSSRSSASANRRSGRWVVAPGSGSIEKNWPLARFVGAAEALAAAGANVAWLLGPAEVERGTRELLPVGATVWEQLPITRIATLVASSTGYLGNDSGTSHLAAALGVPTVALFGPTEAAVWAPRGPAVTVITADSLDEIGVDAVVDACRQLQVGAE